MPRASDVEPRIHRAALARWNEIDAPRLGAALAFYAMLSMAPLLVLCIAIAGLVVGPKAGQSDVMAQVHGLLGPEGARVVKDLLLDVSNRSSSIVAAVLGLGLLLFGASSVFTELHDSLNLVWDVKNGAGNNLAGMIKYRCFSFAMVLGIGFLLLVSLLFSAAIAAAGKFFGAFLPVPEAVLHLLNALLVVRRGHHPIRPTVQSSPRCAHRMARRLGGRGRHIRAVLHRQAAHRAIPGQGQCRVGLWRRGVVGGLSGVGLLLGANLLPGSDVHAGVFHACGFAGAGSLGGSATLVDIPSKYDRCT